MPLPEPNLPSGQFSVLTVEPKAQIPLLELRMEPCQRSLGKQNMGLKMEGIKDGEADNKQLI